jgi:hypothetical protein
MNIIGELDFTSRYCKVGIDQHSLCAGAWIGLGFEAICNCSCHKEKNAKIAVSHSREIALDLDGDESAI